MENRQENKLSMYLAEKKVCDDRRGVWATFAGFKNGYDLFVGHVSALGALAEVQSSARNGVALGKKELTDLMVEAALSVAGSVCAFAQQTGDAPLAAAYDLNRDDLIRLPDAEMDDRALAIHDKAKALLDAETAHPPAAGAVKFSDQLLDAGELSVLHNRIAAYAEVVQSPRAATVKITTATQAIEMHFEQADEVLEKVLDKLVRKFKPANREFFDAYTAARSIVDKAASRSNGNGSGGGTATPVPAAVGAK